MENKQKAFDILGNIAVVRFPKKFKLKDKKKFAKDLLKKHKSVKTVLEKVGKVKGRLRKISTKYLAGEKTKEVLYKENACVFRFNIDKTYFSPRLSNERKEIASLIKKGENVLVMFSGVAPYAIVIAKNSKSGKIYSNEVNREANKYALLNIELNKVKDKVILISGGIKKVAEKINKGRLSIKGNLFLKGGVSVRGNLHLKGGVSVRGNLVPLKFSVIIMPRPQLKDTFLEQAFILSKKGTRIYYYDFCKENEIEKAKEKIKTEAKKHKRKIKILNVKKAGEIAPYKFRIRIDLRVL